jgi:hypothetical protein
LAPKIVLDNVLRLSAGQPVLNLTPDNLRQNCWTRRSDARKLSALGSSVHNKFGVRESRMRTKVGGEF